MLHIRGISALLGLAISVTSVGLQMAASKALADRHMGRAHEKVCIPCGQRVIEWEGRCWDNQMYVWRNTEVLQEGNPVCTYHVYRMVTTTPARGNIPSWCQPLVAWANALFWTGVAIGALAFLSGFWTRQQR